MALYIIAPIVMTIVILVLIKGFSCNLPPQQEREKAVEEKMLSGKQRARRIALILIILDIIGKIARITGGDSTIYMIDIILEPLFIYCFVMFVGYPIVRWIAGRGAKPKDEEKQ